MKECNEYLTIYQKKLLLSMEVLTAMTATTYMIDILFVANLVEHYENNIKNSLEVIQQKEEQTIENET